MGGDARVTDVSFEPEPREEIDQDELDAVRGKTRTPATTETTKNNSS